MVDGVMGSLEQGLAGALKRWEDLESASSAERGSAPLCVLDANPTATETAPSCTDSPTCGPHAALPSAQGAQGVPCVPSMTASQQFQQSQRQLAGVEAGTAARQAHVVGHGQAMGHSHGQVQIPSMPENFLQGPDLLRTWRHPELSSIGSTGSRAPRLPSDSGQHNAPVRAAPQPSQPGRPAPQRAESQSMYGRDPTSGNTGLAAAMSASGHHLKTFPAYTPSRSSSGMESNWQHPPTSGESRSQIASTDTTANRTSSAVMNGSDSNGRCPILRLRDNPRIAKNVEKLDPDELPLWALAKCCGHTADNVDVNAARNAILNFASFSDEEAKMDAYYAMKTWTKKDLDLIAWALDLVRTGKKRDELVNMVISFLAEPAGRRANPRVAAMPSARGSKRFGHSVVCSNGLASNASSTIRRIEYDDRGVPLHADLREYINSSKMRRLSSPQQAPSINGNNGSAPAARRGSSATTLAQMPEPSSIATPPSRFGNISQYELNKIVSPISRHGIATVRDLLSQPFDEKESEWDLCVSKPLSIACMNVSLSAGLQRLAVLTFKVPRLACSSPSSEKGGRIHLRCRQADFAKQPSLYKFCWPFPCSARETRRDRLLSLKQAQRYTNGKEVGSDQSTDITDGILGREGDTVSILFERNSNLPLKGSCRFVVYACVVETRTYAHVLDKVREQSKTYYDGLTDRARRAELELARLREDGSTSGTGDDDDLVVDNLVISLKCPLSLVRIKTPVRSTQCTHMQCFDLTTFVDYSKQTLKMDCPVCNKPARCMPSLLVISHVFEQLLVDFAHADEVSFNPRTQVFSDVRPSARSRNAEASDSDDDDGGAMHRSGVKAEQVEAATPGLPLSECVDLTDEASPRHHVLPVSSSYGTCAVPSQYRSLSASLSPGPPHWSTTDVDVIVIDSD
ncbi:E3 SUMO-protein ligase pli1 [Porphyridium purpureum]|uniref:E3 SUMO-protein ligase pli1 n=1 Tax=Porphyridium purpureum TaxID=35688 RepID=A0A5J4YPX7_PORPP|nr:E3 SUMO-protein ligase pli1 [Porphyridium purpureum]|eukprot:POR8321..scf236_6